MISKDGQTHLGEFFHGMFAGITHEFCWGWNIQDGSCSGWASLFSRLVGLLSQWLSAPREQKLSGPLRARPEIDRAGGQSQVTRPAQIPGRRPNASYRKNSTHVQGWEALLAAVFCLTLERNSGPLLPGARVYSHFYLDLR